MKKQSTTVFTQLSSENLSNLTTIVAETLAMDVAKKSFSAADLWYIQRQKRSFSQRRYSL